MRKKFSGLLAAVILLSVANSASGAEGLLAILEKAKRADPQFLGAGFQRDAVAESVNQARSRLLPSLAFTAERTENKDTYIKSETLVLDLDELKYNTTNTAVTLNQSIYNHADWVRYRQSKVIRSRADVEYDKARQDMLLNVAERYLVVLKTKGQLAAIQAEKKALEGHMDYAVKSRRAGLGRLSDVVDAEARYFTALAEEAEFVKTLNDARFNLMQLTGELPPELKPLREDMPLNLPQPEDSQHWIDLGQKTNPDVLAQQFTLDESRMEVKAQTAGHYPSLNLVLRKYTDKQSDSQFGGGSEIDRDEAAIQLDFPLYEGGDVSSKRREAIKRMHKSQEDLTRIMRSIELDVSSAYQGVVANIAQVMALQKTVASQEEVLRNKIKGQQAGLYTLLIVLDAQRDLADAQRNYVGARYDFAINQLKLKRAAGVLVEPDLGEVSRWLQ